MASLASASIGSLIASLLRTDRVGYMVTVVGWPGCDQVILACLGLIQQQNFAFLFLFAFRYLRLIVHMIGFWFYRPAYIPPKRSVTERDCTVIIPTVDPSGSHFAECVSSIMKSNPTEVIVVTVGDQQAELTKKVIEPYLDRFPDVWVRVLASTVANKRKQVALGLVHVRTRIVCLADDHVFWPSPNFLSIAVAPFENPEIGAVGTNKRVRRSSKGFGFRSFWNFIGAVYLERHNFELRATNTIDGGVFVLPGRTCLYRTCIPNEPKFLAGYLNERIFFGMFGPLNADDDNFFTRWVVRHGWKIKIQYCKETTMETELGAYPKFLSQCLRWARTTYRSNTASLITDRTVWRSQPWCVYAVYFYSLINLALFYDAALFYTLARTDFYNSTAMKALGMWIFAGKMVKLGPYFVRHPSDLIYLPGYFVFAYFHSLLKCYAGMTFWNTTWGGRNLDKINGHAMIAQESTLASLDIDHSDSDSQCSGAGSESSRSSTASTGSERSRLSSVSTGSGLRNTPTNKRPVSTPWGLVTPENTHRKPASILQNTRPGTTCPRDTKQFDGDIQGLRQMQVNHQTEVHDLDEDEAEELSSDVPPDPLTPPLSDSDGNVPSVYSTPISLSRGVVEKPRVVPITFDKDSLASSLPILKEQHHVRFQALPTTSLSGLQLASRQTVTASVTVLTPSPISISTSTPNSKSQRWDPYSRTWIRGDAGSCGRLHCDGSNMVGRDCVLDDKRFRD